MKFQIFSFMLYCNSTWDRKGFMLIEIVLVFFPPAAYLQTSLKNLERVHFDHILFSFKTLYLYLCIFGDICYIFIINDDITKQVFRIS